MTKKELIEVIVEQANIIYRLEHIKHFGGNFGNDRDWFIKLQNGKYADEVEK